MMLQEEDVKDDFAFAKASVVNFNDDDDADADVMAEAQAVDRRISSLDIDKEGVGVITTGSMKGEVQPDTFRDSWAAILFLFQFVAVIGVAIHYSPYISDDVDMTSSSSSSNSNNDDDAAAAAVAGIDYYEESTLSNNFNLSGIFTYLTIAYFVAGLTTMIALNLMMRHSETLVTISFFVAPAAFAFNAILIFVLGDDDASQFFALAAVVVSLMMVCLWFFYKKHIAFAAANLRTALSALRVNTATYLFAFSFSIVSFFTSLISFLAIAGVQLKAESEGMVSCENPEDKNEMCYKNPPNPAMMIFLLLGLYWTQQVITNIIHVTTAGTIGTWWFTPLADYNTFCSSTVTGSLHRACTYSFGSICFGSLLIAIMQVLEQMARGRRRNGEANILTCIIQCIIMCLREWLEYFNSWAFVYVALYGYPYIEAGKSVIALFKNRGWTTLIADRLVFRVLFFCSLAVGALVGSFGLLCNATIGPLFAEGSSIISFLIFFLIGVLISNVVFFVVESAVRTVIVCFAESPAEFQEHHPELSEVMQAGWNEAYPTVMSSNNGIMA